MKKIVVVRLDKACDPEVESLKDVIDFVKNVAASEEVCDCECEKKKNESKQEELSEGTLELISAIAKDLGLDASTLKADVLAQKRAAEAKAKEALKKTQEAAKAKEESENAAKSIKFKLDAAYTTGAIDGYEKGFKDAIKFISSRLNKSLTATLSDLNDMAKWNFKDGTLKEDAVFKK